MSPKRSLCGMSGSRLCQPNGARCVSCLQQDGKTLDHFRIGPLRHVSNKKFCPGCRLISSMASPFVGTLEISDKSTIELRAEVFRFQGLHEDASAQGDAPLVRKVSQRFVEVTLRGLPIGAILRGNEVGLPGATESAGPMFRPEDSLNMYRLRGRIVPPRLGIDQIKKWMHLCSGHNNCRTPVLEAASEQRIRLIDVQEQRIVSATLVEEFAALSYVWGSITGLLTRDTLPKYSLPNGLEHAIIPRTISDSMQLVRNIGIRYLWVDSICIIQDDDDDKHRQIPLMGRIYGSAKLVIVAAAGSDAHAGLLGLRDGDRPSSQRTETIDGIEFMTAHPAVQDTLDRSRWKTRGWTFQEAMLSHRALVFTERQVYWCCRDATWREDIENEYPLAAMKTGSLYEDQFLPETCRTKAYCQIVERFSRRHFTNDGDALWAFAGILERLQSLFRKGFVWALPYERLDATLLWSMSKPSCVHVHSRPARHVVYTGQSRYTLSYPSWSWLSTTSAVTFPDSCGDSIFSQVTWHPLITLGDEVSARYLKSVCQNIAGDKSEAKDYSGLLLASASWRGIMDYGLLHFTAQTADLTISRNQATGQDLGAARELPPGLEKNNVWSDRAESTVAVGGETNPGQHDDSPLDTWTVAAIRSHTGEWIGELEVPLRFFGWRLERSGEFVLLSSSVGDPASEAARRSGPEAGGDAHDGGEHIRRQNIMLIDWRGDIAYRQGLCSMDKFHWEKVETREKRIVLG